MRRITLAVLLSAVLTSVVEAAPIRFGIRELAERSVNELIIPATAAFFRWFRQSETAFLHVGRCIHGRRDPPAKDSPATGL